MFSKAHINMQAALSDKENVGVGYQLSVQSPAKSRTPLKDLNHATPQTRVQKRMQYSPITPCTPNSKTASPLPTAQGEYKKDAGPWGKGQVMLNALLYQEALKVVADATKGLQNELSEKDKYITCLETRLQKSMPRCPLGVIHDEGSEQVNKLSPQKPLTVLRSNSSDDSEDEDSNKENFNPERYPQDGSSLGQVSEDEPIWTGDIITQETSDNSTFKKLNFSLESENVACQDQSSSHHVEEDELPLKCDSFNVCCSPHPTPRPLKPYPLTQPDQSKDYSNSRNKTDDCNFEVEGIWELNKRCDAEKVDLLDKGCTPISIIPGVTDKSQQQYVDSHQLPEDFSHSSSGTRSPASCDGQCLHKCNQTKTSCGTAATPTKVKNVACDYFSPVKLVDVGTGNDVPITMETKCVSTIPPILVDTASMVKAEVVDVSISTEIPHSEAETMVTPVKLHDAGVGNSPMQFTSSETMTTPVRYDNLGVGTSPVHTCSTNTMVTPVKLEERGIGNSPLQMCTSETMVTPIKFQDLGIGQSPIQTSSANTMVTPIKLQDMNVGNSPIQTFSTDTMVTPVKFEELGVGSSPLQIRSIDTMVTPVRMQSVLVGHSPLKTCNVDTSVTPVKFNEISVGTTPSRDNQNNLVDMLNSLHEEYRKTKDYKSRYEESQQRIAVLEGQLKAFVDLSEVLEQATKSQSDANSCLLEGFKRIKELNDETKSEQREFQERVETWRCEKEQLEKFVESTTVKYNRMKEEYVTFHERVQSAEEELQETRCSLVSLQEENDQLREQNINLHMRGSTHLQELNLLRGQYESLKEQHCDLRTKNEAFRQLYQKLLKSSTETKEFLETEHGALQEELTETKNAYETTKLELSRCSAMLQQSSTKIQSLEEELEATKSNAQLLMMAQGSEISESIISVATLNERLTVLYSDLVERNTEWEVEVNKTDEVAENIESQDSHVASVKVERESPSFVTSVLCASDKEIQISEKDSDTVTESLDENSPSAFVRLSNCHVPALGNGEELPIRRLSAFVPVRGPVKFGESPCFFPTSQSEDSSHVNDLGMNLNFTNQLDGEKDLPLNEQVEELHGIVGDLVAVIKDIQLKVQKKCSFFSSKVADIQCELEMQQDESNKLLKKEHSKMESMEWELKNCHRTETFLRKEITELREKITGKDQELAQARQLLLQKADQLQSLADQESHIKKLKVDNDRLHNKLQQMEAECQLLHESFNSAVSNVEGHDGVYLRENLLLKKELSKRRHQNMKIREQAEELALKANSRQKTFSENLKKAESEITMLDNLIDKIRQVLLRYKDDVHVWPEMKHLWPELIGSDDNFTLVKSTPVTPSL